MFILTIQEFIGHFHPVLVHLPIGILIFACLLQWLERKEKGSYHRAVTAALLLGMISAVVSCISGYLLSRSDDYDDQLTGWHQWLGISVAATSAVLYFLHKKDLVVRWQRWIGVALLLLIIITGHLGGSLTHGSEYLTASLFNKDAADQAERKPIPNVQEALVYDDVIQPLLKSKCYSCHNANKKKGGLQMDDPLLLMKGGKNGVIVMAGNAGESEMIKRLLLPREEKEHMPPKEKPQLNEQEIALLHWWIASGASFDKKVNALEQPEKIKPVLLALQNVADKQPSLPDVPETPVQKASEEAILKLREKGVVVLPVSQNSNYLVANFVTADSISDKDLQLLLPLKKQLVWLKLGSMPVGDMAMTFIAQCSRITRLHLDRTRITDAGLEHLKALKELQYLNLVGTGVTAQGVLQLQSLPVLQSLYLYQTQIDKAEWSELQKAFPKAQVDSGGYETALEAGSKGEL